jgi:hypothetical protein
VDDIVAVRVRLDSGDSRYFVTWGRAFDAVDPTKLQEVVLRYAGSCALGGEPVSAEVCWSLRDARDETYFYEAVADFAAQLASRPADSGWRGWLDERATEMENGREIYYLGLPHD